MVSPLPSSTSSPTPPSNPPPTKPSKPFRFKRPRPRSPSPPSLNSRYRSHRHRRHHHRYHHRSHHKQSPTPPDDPTLYDDSYIPNARSGQYLHPDVAFRESLFDALADDEGAAFWEGVYGQPIHTYSPYTPKTSYDDDDTIDADGKPRLERMSDNEYVDYVRSKMWEKSHEHILEERRKREEDRRKRKEKERVAQQEGRRFMEEVEEGLRRGKERRRQGRWNGVWERYTTAWSTPLTNNSDPASTKPPIPWPVESFQRKDVHKDSVEEFFRCAPLAAGVREENFGDALKRERVRWHPDKMVQRAGGGGLDEGTLKVVTGVFLVVDRLWGEVKGRV